MGLFLLLAAMGKITSLYYNSEDVKKLVLLSLALSGWLSFRSFGTPSVIG